MKQPKRIQFKCPNCQTKYSALPEQAGKEGRCKNCSNKLVVPEPHKHDAKNITGKEDNRGRKGGSKKINYWFGYIYASFTAYLALIQFSNFIAVFVSGEIASLTADTATETSTYVLLNLCGGVWLGFVCVKLFRKTGNLAMVYSVAAIHGFGVFIRSAVLGTLTDPNLFIWLLTSGYAIYYFRKYYKVSLGYT